MILTKDEYEKLLEMFTAPDGLKVEEYHTQSVLEYETTGQWSIQLGYGYNKAGKRIIYGATVKFATLDIAIKVMQILHQFKQERKNLVIDNLDFLKTEAPKPAGDAPALSQVKEPDADVTVDAEISTFPDVKSKEESLDPFGDNGGKFDMKNY